MQSGDIAPVISKGRCELELALRGDLYPAVGIGAGYLIGKDELMRFGNIIDDWPC